jgi:hypothetical protein
MHIALHELIEVSTLAVATFVALRSDCGSPISGAAVHKRRAERSPLSLALEVQRCERAIRSSHQAKPTIASPPRSLLAKLEVHASILVIIKDLT